MIRKDIYKCTPSIKAISNMSIINGIKNILIILQNRKKYSKKVKVKQKKLCTRE
jgi:hypothetical protein